MRFAARFLFVSVFSILYLVFSTHFANAQTYTTNPYMTPNTDTNVPSNLHTYTQSIILEVISGLTCQIMGIDPATGTNQCLGFNQATGKIGYAPANGGAIGFVGNMISSLYSPPLHTGDFVKYVASNFGFVKHSYAAPVGASVTGCSGNGCGFDHLSPLLGVWTTFRNVAYFVFVLVFIAIGFMIMLRVKIDPRTVMSIENQIPKLIIALLLVTFSYAIAGFFIDLMNVTDYLVINLVTSSQTDTNYVSQIHNTEKSDLAGGNPFGFANDIVPGGIIGISLGSAGGVKDIVQNLFTPQKIGNPSGNGNSAVLWGSGAGFGTAIVCTAVSLGTLFIPCALAGLVVGVATGLTVGGVDVGDMVTKALGTIVSWVAGLLAFFIIAIALLIAMFRVWFGLLMAYVGILLDVVFAPFWIIAGLFPGSKIGFGSWFKDIVSNLIAFPVTIVMFLLAGIFANNFASANAYTTFNPPLIGNVNGTIAGRSPLAYIIALGMIMMTPGVVNMMRELFQAPKQTYMQQIATNLSTGTVPFTQGLKGVTAFTRKNFLNPKEMMRWRGVLEAFGG